MCSGNILKPKYGFKFCFGVKGESLHGPWGIAVAKNGETFVANHYSSNISVFDANGVFQRGICRPNPQSNLIGITLDKEEKNVYAAEYSGNRIICFDRSGDFIKEFGEDAKLKNPYDLTFDSEGNLKVADTRNRRIVTFTPDGEFLPDKTFGKQESNSQDNDCLSSPTGVRVDPRNGNVVVFDEVMGHVKVFDPHGKFIRVFGPPHIENPYSGDIDARGNVVCVDSGQHRVVAFSPEGEFLWQIGGDTTGDKQGEFNYPQSLIVDQQGRLLVVEFSNNRVSVFE